MNAYADMKKTELRAACKAAGISYGELTVGGMKDALTAHANNLLAAQANASLPLEELGEFGRGTAANPVCPHCGIDHIDNGLLTADDYEPNGTRTMYEAGLMNSEYECMGCGGQWGPVRAPYVKPAPKADAHTGTGLKIEKNREERNGVKRPSLGGKCRAVWDALDALQAELEAGEKVTAAMVKDLAKDEGWNHNNASIEFYNWRKFNGIKGR